MGVKMNAQNNVNSTYVQAVNEITSITAIRALRPWLHLDFIFYMTTTGRRYKKCLQVLHGTAEKVIKERREELLEMGKDSAMNSAIDVDDIDTTEAALSFAIYLLACHPDVQEELLEELKSVFDWSQPLQPSIQQLGELKYLEMVIKETLRLYPPVPVVVRDITNDEKLPSTGHLIPEGAVMLICPWAAHRNPEVYPDPEKFDPERFSAGETARRHPYAFLPFSAGPRNCMGEAHAQFVVLEQNVMHVAFYTSNYSWLPLMFTPLHLPALKRRPAQLHRSAIRHAGDEKRAVHGNLEFRDIFGTRIYSSSRLESHPETCKWKLLAEKNTMNIFGFSKSFARIIFLLILMLKLIVKYKR
ncbi:Cytochrome P450 4C1 [Gryllus bimaculatus]|nr:Cytochrome P450 4C1 [Gryllus bimaculatus]